MRVPGAENAYVDPAKVRDYLLSIEHPVGHRKAVFFAQLGYTRAEWPRLRRDLYHLATLDRAQVAGDTAYGRKFAVDAMLQGPAGHSAHVVSVWIIRNGEDFPRFVTAYPGVFG